MNPVCPDTMRVSFSKSGGASRRLRGGFTLVETMIAMMVTAMCLLGLYGASSQAIRIVRTGKQIAAASQMLQQRIEYFRYTPPWSNITTAAGITALVTGATTTAANFPNATETFTVSPYPAGGTPLVVTRGPSGAITSSGSDLPAQTCVKLTVTVTWNGIGGSPRSRQVSTIMTKGGI